MNPLISAGAVVVGVGLLAWLLRRASGPEEIDRSVLAGKSAGVPAGVSSAEPEDEEQDAGGLDEPMRPEQALAVSSHGEVFLPYGGQVHVLPLGDVRDHIAAGITSWEAVEREVLHLLRLEGAAQSPSQLNAGDFTGGRIQRGAPDDEPWRLELLGREGEYLVFVFETQEAARLALSLLEESGVIRRPVDEDGRPVPASPEDFEEARRRYEATIRELASMPEEPGEGPGDGGGGGARAQAGDEAVAARMEEGPRGEAERAVGIATSSEPEAIAGPEPRLEEPVSAGQLAAEAEAPSDLPSPEARDWLIAQLADLVRRAGPEPFLCAPLILPNDSFFPDRWQGDAASVQRLAERLLGYAGIEPSARDAQAGTAIDVTPDLLAAPDVLVAALAHATTRVWRARHALAGPPSRTEEALADLTTIHLGFGILTVNAAYRGRASGKAGGYLSSQALCFLLALQAVVCDIPRGRYKRWLDPTQGIFFDAAFDELAPRLDELIGRLGLPPEDQWPEPWASPAERS